MNPIRRSQLATFALATLAFCTGTAKCADLNPAAQKLEGTWLITVTRLNPPPNLPPAFQSLMANLPGGAVIETSNTGRTNRGPAFGEWVRTGSRQFTTTFYFFRFAAGEVYAGLTKVVRNVQLNEDLQTFRAVSVQEQYDPQGTLIATLRGMEEGRRLPMGEIPDQP
jgi:hypothetical protein